MAMPRLLVPALVFVVSSAPAGAQLPAARPSPVVVRDAWVRTPAPSVPMTAGYLTIDNPSDHDVTLVAATSIAAGRIELHEMRDENGRASMRMVDKVVIPARGSVALAPGGLHLMLIGMPKALVAGDEVPITLHMSNGTVAVARATVRTAQQ
ncbi:MAG: copper chaperone PCu(A)C [Acidobacteria bacterium]|nr:copper chaperone PCu(A)C [Acidobacteriota bacterium]